MTSIDVKSRGARYHATVEFHRRFFTNGRDELLETGAFGVQPKRLNVRLLFCTCIRPVGRANGTALLSNGHAAAVEKLTPTGSEVLQEKTMKPAALREFILRAQSLIYLWAFGSLYYQVPGLYGDNGILPVRSILECDDPSVLKCSFAGEHPTILHLLMRLALSPSQAMELTCLLGMALAIVSYLFACVRDALVFLAMWFLYLSCVQVGQIFLWYQWDTLLLEAGFLMFLVAPCRVLRPNASSWLPHDNVTLFLVRWLTFRLMFASGIVKLANGCPTWWSLTALHYHFESQCIPTPLAWFAHQIPGWFKQLSVLATFLILILLSPFMLLPVKHLRWLAFLGQSLLMVLIILTGNFNFFNLICMVLSTSSLVDSSHSAFGTHVMKPLLGRAYNFFKWLLVVTAYAYVVYVSAKTVSMKYDPKELIHFSLKFSKEEFSSAVGAVLLPILLLASAAFIIEVFSAIRRCTVDFPSESFLRKVSIFTQCCAICLVATLMFSMSLVPLSWLDRGASAKMWPSVVSLQRSTDKYQLTHSYGLFSTMTGVGGRPEVTLEGALSRDGPWQEYGFLYKVGDVTRRPPINIPHQPRIDWQLWFAALDSSYLDDPWFISLVYRLFTNSTDVLKLIDRNPFAKAPPKFLKSNHFLYHYTTYADLKTKKGWWWREFNGPYMPALAHDNPHLVRYLAGAKMLVQGFPVTSENMVTFLLSTVRYNVERMRAPEFLWTLTVTILLPGIAKKILTVK